ncbi:MAG: hypothetical protein V4736_04525 [Bdellovibrionota bacterium]
MKFTSLILAITLPMTSVAAQKMIAMENFEVDMDSTVTAILKAPATPVVIAEDTINCVLMHDPAPFKRTVQKGAEFTILTSKETSQESFTTEDMRNYLKSAHGINVNPKLSKEEIARKLETDNKLIFNDGPLNKVTLKMQSGKSENEVTVQCMSSLKLTYRDVLIKLLKAGKIAPFTEL